MEAGTPPSAGFYDFLGWLETNKKRIAIGAAALFLIGVLVGFVIWRSGQRAMEAEETLSSIRTTAMPGELPPAGAAEALIQVAEEFPKTAAAPKALLRAGTVYFDQNNFVKAQEQFDKLLRNYGDTIWVPQAVYGVAASLEAQAKMTEAIAKYNDFIRNYPGDSAAEQARFSLARLYQQTKQPALALEVLKKMTDAQAGGFSPGAAEAQERMKEIYTKHPELIPPPPASPAAAIQNFTLPTNAASLTNVIRVTNAIPSPSTNAPVILLPQGNTNAAK